MTHRGEVKFFREDKGFGFITDLTTGVDIFVHISDVAGQQLQEGDRVTFEKMADPYGKMKAFNVCGGTGPEVPRQVWGSKGKGKGKRKARDTGALAAEGQREMQEALARLSSDPAVPAVELPPLRAVLALDSDMEGELEFMAGDVGSTGLAVATYNLLHPLYAGKYGEEQGVWPLENPGEAYRSNWSERALAISVLLLEGGMDVYFLQEVGLQQLLDLRQHMGGQLEPIQLKDSIPCGVVMDLGPYRCVHYTHPARSARDGVAVLLRAPLTLLGQCPVKFMGTGLEEAKRGDPYMCAAVALAKTPGGHKVALASTHFYDKKADHPQDTLLSALELPNLQAALGHSVDGVVWGGDCNRSYGEAPSGYAFAYDGMQPTRPGGRQSYIDWLFASAERRLTRSPRTKRFITLTGLALQTTKMRASDHYADAVMVDFT